jgi:hypothetical protein
MTPQHPFHDTPFSLSGVREPTTPATERVRAGARGIRVHGNGPHTRVRPDRPEAVETAERTQPERELGAGSAAEQETLVVRATRAHMARAPNCHLASHHHRDGEGALHGRNRADRNWLASTPHAQQCLEGLLHGKALV